MNRICVSALALLALAGSAMGSVFYGVTDGTLVRIDTAANATTTIGTLQSGPTSLSVMADCDFNASGELIGIRQGSDFNAFPPAPLNQAFRINTATAGALQLSSFGAGTRLNALAHHAASDQFYTVNADNGRLATINVTTGVATTLFGTPHGLTPSFRVDALAFAPDGSLYGIWDAGVAFAGTFDYRLVLFNTATGTATNIGPIGVANVDRFLSLRFDEAGTAYTVNSVTGTMHTINLATGQGTALFSDPALIGVTGLAHVVPAPGAAALLGVCLLFPSRRRR